MSFHLSSDSLDWALAHIQRYGDTDIFPRPFEFEAAASEWEQVKAHLSSQDLDQWVARSARVCLTPKRRYAYRISTQLDPLDCLIYCALIYEAGPALEAARIQASDEVVVSHRFLPTPDGHLYDPTFNWNHFLEMCRDRTGNGSASHVVLADVSDFFPRLYHHRVQNALESATNGSPQARVIFKLLDQWAGTPSYGIPVGPSPSRLIAEVTLDDVDQCLRAEGANFCRYSDDYRIFCTSDRDAYEKLSTLALSLFHNHGLTLQPAKTEIVSVEDFAQRFLSSHESEELQNLTSRFDDFLSLTEVTTNPYEPIDYDDLSPEAKAIIDELNLEDLLRGQLGGDEMDIGLVRFILRRLAQLDDSDVAVELMQNAERCYPVLAQVMEYLNALRDVPAEVCRAVGDEALKLLDSSTVAHLPYHRCWLLSLFASSPRWGHARELPQAFGAAADPFTRRKVTLGLGRASQAFWFRAKRDSARTMDPWERRAFLAGASCFPQDERKHWYGSIRRWLDPLEKATVEWVRSNPF